MEDSLLLKMVERMSIAATLAFLLSQTSLLQRLNYRSVTIFDKAKLAVIFGLIGIVGTLIGGVLGVIAALNVSELVGWMERVSGQHIFSSDVYFVSNLPSELQGGDVALICTAGFVLSFLATLYPAYRAAKIQPAHALRYS